MHCVFSLPRIKLMSWRTSGQADDETTALRTKQIDSLTQQFTTLQIVLKDALYDLPLNLPSGACVLRM